MNLRTPRPLLARRPGGHGSTRDYDSIRGAGWKGATPSVDFDWGTALYLNALTLRSLGYRLTPEQQARIDNHG